MKETPAEVAETPAAAQQATPDRPVDWEAIARTAAANPVTITHNEDGTPITHGPLCGPADPVKELDDDVELD